MKDLELQIKEAIKRTEERIQSSGLPPFETRSRIEEIELLGDTYQVQICFVHNQSENFLTEEV
ncbi:hypothetical protein C900_05398 [Fulvivirga imtechensis AK7]|uniref:Uncharacterized protein n=1 Tax=Fulvivirga imtechensis AK7 TaxID=1237149 RepID=L8JP94_9BACT|nr:hypothetical protein [Fulvivirga imtechensis]ELR69202.1 hypothetical protein C900_05398 [Fulvivirga imtechensis AK7]